MKELDQRENTTVRMRERERDRERERRYKNSHCFCFIRFAGEKRGPTRECYFVGRLIAEQNDVRVAKPRIFIQ